MCLNVYINIYIYIYNSYINLDRELRRFIVKANRGCLPDYNSRSDVSGACLHWLKVLG